MAILMCKRWVLCLARLPTGLGEQGVWARSPQTFASGKIEVHEPQM